MESSKSISASWIPLTLSMHIMLVGCSLGQKSIEGFGEAEARRSRADSEVGELAKMSTIVPGEPGTTGSKIGSETKSLVAWLHRDAAGKVDRLLLVGGSADSAELGEDLLITREGASGAARLGFSDVELSTPLNEEELRADIERDYPRVTFRDDLSPETKPTSMSLPRSGRVVLLRSDRGPRVVPLRRMEPTCRGQSQSCTHPVVLRIPTSAIDERIAKAMPMDDDWRKRARMLDELHSKALDYQEGKGTSLTTVSYARRAQSWERARTLIRGANRGLRHYRQILEALVEARELESTAAEREIAAVDSAIQYNNWCYASLQKKIHCRASSRREVRKKFSYRRLAIDIEADSLLAKGGNDADVDGFMSSRENASRIHDTLLLDAFLSGKLQGPDREELDTLSREAWENAITVAEREQGLVPGSWANLLRREELHFEARRDGDEFVVTATYLVSDEYAEVWDIDNRIVTVVRASNGKERRALSTALASTTANPTILGPVEVRANAFLSPAYYSENRNVIVFRFDLEWKRANERAQREADRTKRTTRDGRHSTDDDDFVDPRFDDSRGDVLSFAAGGYSARIPVEWKHGEGCEPQLTEALAVSATFEALEAWKDVRGIRVDCTTNTVQLEMIAAGEVRTEPVPKQPLDQLVHRLEAAGP